MDEETGREISVRGEGGGAQRIQISGSHTFTLEVQAIPHMPIERHDPRTT